MNRINIILLFAIYLISIITNTVIAENSIIKKIQSPDSLVVTINLSENFRMDTLQLQIFTYRWSNYANHFHKVSKNENGLFVFNIPVEQTEGYWIASMNEKDYNNSGSKVNRPISIPFFWEAGDDIFCTIDNMSQSNHTLNFKYSFTGRGQEKYALRIEVLSNDTGKLLQKNTPNEIVWYDDMFNYIKKENQSVLHQLSQLENKKNLVSETAYQALKSDILFRYGRVFYSKTREEFSKRFANSSSSEKLNAIFNFKSSTLMKNAVKEDSFFYKEGFLKSLAGVEYLYYVFKTSLDLDTITNDPQGMYNLIVNNSKGKLRENLLSYFFTTTKMPQQIDSIITDAKKYFNTPEGIVKYYYIENIVRAKDLFIKRYNLFDIHNKQFEFNLANYKNKVVFIDFYYIGCGACKRLYENTVSKVKKYYEDNNNVLFIAISIDKNYDYWLKGVLKNEYTSKTPNTINLFAGDTGFRNPIFQDFNILAFPKIILFKGENQIQFNTDNLYTVEGLTEAIDSYLLQN